mmetsp:Transcript_18853/g.30940  ORF Transcript_18853/g.30940 Transcript_18853/m.30940 type:complete len:445 (+) Transcript_18853:168-1502(+)
MRSATAYFVTLGVLSLVFAQLALSATPTIRRTSTALRSKTFTFRRTSTRTRTVLRTFTRTRTVLRTFTRTRTIRPPTPKAGCAARLALRVGTNDVQIVASDLKTETLCNVTSPVARLSFIAPNDATYVLTSYYVQGEYLSWGYDAFAFFGYTVSNAHVLQNASTCSTIRSSCTGRGVFTSGAQYQGVSISLKRNQAVLLAIRSCTACKHIISVTEYLPPGCAPSVLPGTPPLALGANYLGNPCTPPVDFDFKMCGKNLYKAIPRYFTAPTAGAYIFESTVGVPQALSVRDGCTVLGCASAFDKPPPRVVVRLRAGQRVTVLTGGTDWVCVDLSVLVTKAPKECNITADCPLVPSGGSPRAGYTCLNHGCVPRYCSAALGIECPYNCNGQSEVCENDRCVPEYAITGGLLGEDIPFFVNCRFCFENGSCQNGCNCFNCPTRNESC